MLLLHYIYKEQGEGTVVCAELKSDMEDTLDNKCGSTEDMEGGCHQVPTLGTASVLFLILSNIFC